MTMYIIFTHVQSILFSGLNFLEIEQGCGKHKNDHDDIEAMNLCYQ